MKNKYLKRWPGIMLILCGIALAAVLFVPMWKIELNAPQYPEGLELKIYPHKLGGNVDIINGLNHYIGMKTLHTKDFIEFTILPYIIGFFSLCCFIAAFLNRKRWLIVLTSLFILFGIVAMIDFWRWEYNYGHNLDPTAAIQIPGMAYQPPLIGYKQLLNFGAYSIPDTGGLLFVAVGLMLVLSIVIQILSERKSKKLKASVNKPIVIAGLFLIFLSSCNTGPQPIKTGVDACAFCKMTIADEKFGGEIITKKNKIFKFDDIHCLLLFKKSGTVKPDEIKDTYLVKYDGAHDFVEISKSYLFKSEKLRSPMGGNIAAFDNNDSLQKAVQKVKGSIVKWDQLK
jgi:copper chaperone NosL